MYLISFVLLFNNSNMWQCLSGSPFSSGTIKIVLIVLLFGGIAVNGNKMRFPEDSIITVLGVLLYLSIYAIGTKYNVCSFFLSFALIFIFMYLYSTIIIQKGLVQKLARTFSQLMVIIATISIAFWALGSIARIMPGRTRMIYEWAESNKITYSYFGLYFENPVQNNSFLGRMMVRNCGIFTEAPSMAGMLLYALVIELFSVEKSSRPKIMILLISLFTTFSTKGILLSFLAVCLKYIISKPRGYILNIVKYVIGFWVLILAGYICYIIVIDKMNSAYSFKIRMDDIFSALQAWKNNPLFGNGYYNDDSIRNYFNVYRDNDGLSMGIPILLAEGGIWMLMFYCGAIFSGIENTVVKSVKKEYFAFVLIIICNLFISNVAWSMIYMMFLAFGYASHINYKIKGIK